MLSHFMHSHVSLHMSESKKVIRETSVVRCLPEMRTKAKTSGLFMKLSFLVDALEFHHK